MHALQAEGVLEEHRRDVRRICLADGVVKVSRSPAAGLRTRAITQVPGSGTARSRGQRPTHNARDTRSGVDGGEHSAMLDRVMARGLLGVTDVDRNRCRNVVTIARGADHTGAT